MTETRKPYDPEWPHGFETRDGRKVTERDVVFGGGAYWELPDGTLFVTNDRGRVSGLNEYDLDIFCTPASAERPLECWVNVYSDGDWSMFDSHEGAARSGGYGRPGERIAVHMREVTPEPVAKELGGRGAGGSYPMGQDARAVSASGGSGGPA